MRIIPAIDIINGKCVRLTQGDYGQMKIYNDDPVKVALSFQDADLEYLHLVDLDGAQKGKVVNWEAIEEIQEKTALSVDFGGGVKTEEEVERLLGLGIHQINVGSLAVKQPEVFIGWMKQYGADNFILSVDVKDEDVLINGWMESTGLRLYDLVDKFKKEGLEYFTCTDIRTDGMLEGPNLTLYKKLKNRFPEMKITASGGVSSMDDLRELNYLKLHGAIVGKAIYEGRINLKDLRF